MPQGKGYSKKKSGPTKNTRKKPQAKTLPNKKPRKKPTRKKPNAVAGIRG